MYVTITLLAERRLEFNDIGHAVTRLLGQFLAVSEIEELET
jgi:hypothetical protein